MRTNEAFHRTQAYSNLYACLVVTHESVRLLKSHYETLGLDPDASKGEIDAAWRREASLWHPDRNSSPEASAKMKEVNAAHHVLSNTSRRMRYDIRNGFVSPGRPHMKSPVRDTGAKSKDPSTENPKREDDSRFTRATPSESKSRWWRRVIESLDAPSSEDENIRTETIFERRPRFTRFVLLPLGVLSILLAAAITLALA